MYVIAKAKDGYRAVLIQRSDNWDVYKLRVGQTERRIILRVRGRRYMVYTTNPARDQYPSIGTEQMDALCDEIIEVLRNNIASGQEYVDLPRVAEAALARHRKRWIENGIIPLTMREEYYGHPLDPAAQQLVTHVRVDLSDLIIMDHEPPIDCEQEELPY